MKILSFLFLSFISINTSLAAFTEDVGELVSTAQGAPRGAGSIDTINGSLDFDGVVGFDAVDLFKISVTDSANFSVSMTARYSVDINVHPDDNNTAGLWLFDTDGNYLDDDSFYDLLFGGPANFFPLPNGNYLFAVALFGVMPDSIFGDLSTGWDKTFSNIQRGSYQISLTGAELSQVPLPAAFWLFSAGLMTLIRSRKKIA